MKQQGFTLAEVLLTLAVIGIVAAITLPSLLVDTTEKAFDAQKRALHARLAQAIGMMSSLSGYGTYTEETKEGAGDGKDNAAETFLYEGLSKVYKMNNICDSDNLDKCGIPSSITTMAGTTMSFPKKLSELNPSLINLSWGENSDRQTTDTKAAAFETVNGESIAVFYNPNCKNDTGGHAGTKDNEPLAWLHTQNKMCVNFIYDLNGLKGPNKVGRDIGFITALYAKNSEVVAPIPFESDLSESYTQQEAVEGCANYSDDARLPNRHELSSLFYNKILINNFDNYYWSSSIASAINGWELDCTYGVSYQYTRSQKLRARCIRK